MKPKYQAYHKKEKKFFLVDAIDFKGSDCFGAVIDFAFVPIEDIILVHLTGRQDKFGVEIHEGHTLLTPFSDFVWHVKFGEFQYQEARSHFIGFYIECSVTGRTLPLSEFNRHEVTGNWFEKH